jgi:hypothetical protein
MNMTGHWWPDVPRRGRAGPFAWRFAALSVTTQRLIFAPHRKLTWIEQLLPIRTLKRMEQFELADITLFRKGKETDYAVIVQIGTDGWSYILLSSTSPEVYAPLTDRAAQHTTVIQAWELARR